VAASGDATRATRSNEIDQINFVRVDPNIKNVLHRFINMDGNCFDHVHQLIIIFDEDFFMSNHSQIFSSEKLQK
jgi:hypothetical protein